MVSSNQHFHILNNFSHISTHFFTHMYIKNTQTTLLKLTNQMGPKNLGLVFELGNFLEVSLQSPFLHTCFPFSLTMSLPSDLLHSSSPVVRLDLINHFVGFIPCQVCNSISNLYLGGNHVRIMCEKV